MNEYSIFVSNGKVIGDSVFFRIANDLLDKEIKRLCNFTDVLDKDPTQKRIVLQNTNVPNTDMPL